MEFASKGYFLLLLLLIPYILWYFLYRKKNAPTMRMSDTKNVSICSEEPACASHPSANGAEMHLLRAHRLCDGSSADAYGLGQQDGRRH